jgi:NAD(P)-dependent dehydrogenase (short-subunit alcohol dehydrogenase family)
MSFSLKRKIALVTGSSRGIGRAIAERLAAHGAAVVVNYARSPQQAREVVDGIKARDGKALAIQADVSKPAEVKRLFDETEKQVGPLDIVVANAGVYLSKPFVENTEADYDHVFNINTRGVFSRCRKPPVACATVVESSLFLPEVRRCHSLMLRFTLEAKRRWSNSSDPSRAKWVRAT